MNICIYFCWVYSWELSPWLKSYIYFPFSWIFFFFFLAPGISYLSPCLQDPTPPLTSTQPITLNNVKNNTDNVVCFKTFYDFGMLHSKPHSRSLPFGPNRSFIQSTNNVPSLEAPHNLIGTSNSNVREDLSQNQVLEEPRACEKT